jgi:hypothetical protein
MVKRIGLAVIGLALFVAPMTASAESPWAAEPTYGAQAGAKLKYGLTNTLLGWTSLIRTPVQAAQDGENVLVGIVRGVYNGVGQTVLGAAHAVTFPITAIDIPLPEGGTDLLG